MKHLRTLRGYLVVFVVAFAISRSCLFLVRGPSMAPTIADPSVIVVLPVVLSEPRKGDMVVLRDPWRKGTTMVKRVKAVAGECMPAKPGRVESAACQRIPPGQMFVVGDNEPFSTDSRSQGLAPTSSAAGKVMFAMPVFRTRS